MSFPWLVEGYYWLDNNGICYFDKDKIKRKKVSLKIVTIKEAEKYKYRIAPKILLKRDPNPISWQEYVATYPTEYEYKAVNVAREAISKYPDYQIFCLNSTGKDSTVTLDIVRRTLNREPRVVFNNTSLDVRDTYLLVKSHPKWEITNPKEGFYPWSQRMGFIPTRVSRACCTKFKEGNHIEHYKNVGKALWFMGVRNAESQTRANYNFIRVNPKWTERHLDWVSCSPILKFSEMDIWVYILRHRLEINPKYKKGYTRVGCAIACPYYTKYTWALDEYWYPSLYRRWRNVVDKDFIDHSRWTQLNCTRAEYQDNWNGTLMRSEPTSEVVNEFMNYSGIQDENIAKGFFNKTCAECGKNIRQRDTIAMNMKFNGRTTDRLYCKKCFKKHMNWDEDQWQWHIKAFNRQDCALFTNERDVIDENSPLK